mmetsp:Transcript_8617/g.24185  ORF Transcript_8617/g.24185 Transcript_8617/m.24185 type:complete len:456 (-) Transcript_8617:253-1620(-)
MVAMEEFSVGMQVCLSGLRGEPALNGQTGVSLGPSGSLGRVQVRLAGGRELSVRGENLRLAGAAGTIPVGSCVTLVGLAKAPELNGREGTVAGVGEAGSGRLLVDLGSEGGQPKALKAENLVLLAANSAAAPNEGPEGVPGIDPELPSEKTMAARRATAAAAKGFPAGSRARIHGIVEEKGRENSGDPALNGKEGTVEGADPDEPGRLILKLVQRHHPGQAGSKEQQLKSISYKNLTRLDAPVPETTDNPSLEAPSKRPALQAPDSTGAALQVLGAGGKRCKIAEIAVAAGDKTAAFASAARNRDLATPSSGPGNSAQDEAARSNALIYARTDAASPDDEVAGPALARLAKLCPNFAMKAVCLLAVDILAHGNGKLGSKSAEAIEGLAGWLTGGEGDGILRRRLEAGQACAGVPDGLTACQRCAEKGLKDGRLLGLLRKNSGGLRDFVSRGCKER